MIPRGLSILRVVMRRTGLQGLKVVEAYYLKYWQSERILYISLGW